MSSVIYVTTDFTPYKNAGVIRATSLVAELNSQDIPVTVITCKGGVSNGNERVVQTLFRNPQNERKLIARSFREVAFCIEVIFRLLFMDKKSVIVFSSPPFSILISAILAKLFFSRIILDIRDLYPDVYFNSGISKPTSLLGRLLKRLERCAYNSSSTVITVCESLSSAIISRTNNSNVSVIMNGFPDYFLNLKKTIVDNENDPLLIVSHGNFGRFQNIEFLLWLAHKSLSSQLSIKFLFIGFGSKLEELRERAPSNVEVLDSVPQEELVDILSRCDIGISARTDNFIGRHAVPVKVIEYVGLGMRALVLPAMNDLKSLEDGGLISSFEYSDKEAVFEQLKYMSNMPKNYVSEYEGIAPDVVRYSRKSLAKEFVKHIKRLE